MTPAVPMSGKPDRTWRSAASLGLACLSCGCILWAAGGATLNLYLASAVVAAVLTPIFMIEGVGIGRDLLSVAAGTLGTSACWQVSAVWSAVSAGQMFRCSAVLVGVLAAEVSAARLLRICRVEATLVRAAVVVGGLVWLTWPLWLTAAPPLGVRIHPLLGINGVLAPPPTAGGAGGSNLGIWTEQPVAYSIMALGQDVPYLLPASPWPGVGAHLALAAFGAIVTTLVGAGRAWQKRGGPEP